MSSNRKPDNYTNYENPEVACSELNFFTRILNPQEHALKGVDIGDVLSINLISASKIEVINALGEMCGVIAAPEVDRLLKCMKAGNKYQAEVINIKSPLCDVRINYIS